MTARASVLLSTFEQPRLLDLALYGYARQTATDFEILIGDDGSGEETRAIIEKHAASLPIPVKHVRQPDDGFRKARALNLAVLQSEGSHLIFSDGDCIPSATFVEEHIEASRPTTYIVGGHMRLSPETTDRMTPDQVLSGQFETLATPPVRARLWWMHVKSLGYIAIRKRRKPKFYGMNFSLDRESFYRVNGYDSTYRNLAREDSDLRNRLQLGGIRARSLWHRARVFHLHHPAHSQRLGWREGVAYYNRPDLRPEATDGLRELEEKGEGVGTG